MRKRRLSSNAVLTAPVRATPRSQPWATSRRTDGSEKVSRHLQAEAAVWEARQVLLLLGGKREWRDLLGTGWSLGLAVQWLKMRRVASAKPFRPPAGHRIRSDRRARG